MSYAPTTDFLALLRNVGGAERVGSMPGLDWFVEALARAGFVTLSVGQSAPIANQAATAWFQPAVPSWSAEGQLFLWNTIVTAYQPATPALWQAYFLPLVSGYLYQSVTLGAATIAAGTTLCAINRAAPATTILTLPAVGAQQLKKLQIVDFSTGVTNHAITLSPAGADTIMSKATWQLLSTADQLAGIMLQPSPDLTAWVIAP